MEIDEGTSTRAFVTGEMRDTLPTTNQVKMRTWVNGGWTYNLLGTTTCGSPPKKEYRSLQENRRFSRGVQSMHFCRGARDLRRGERGWCCCQRYVGGGLAVDFLLLARSLVLLIRELGTEIPRRRPVVSIDPGLSNYLPGSHVDSKHALTT